MCEEIPLKLSGATYYLYYVTFHNVNTLLCTDMIHIGLISDLRRCRVLKSCCYEVHLFQSPDHSRAMLILRK